MSNIEVIKIDHGWSTVTEAKYKEEVDKFGKVMKEE